MNKKHKLYHRYKDKTHPAYIRIARQSKKEVRRARRNFEKRLADNIKCDTKSFFSYVRNKSKSRPSVNKIIDDTGRQIDNPMELVEKFNEFFASVFTRGGFDRPFRGSCGLPSGGGEWDSGYCC